MYLYSMYLYLYIILLYVFSHFLVFSHPLLSVSLLRPVPFLSWWASYSGRSVRRGTDSALLSPGEPWSTWPIFAILTPSCLKVLAITEANYGTNSCRLSHVSRYADTGNKFCFCFFFSDAHPSVIPEQSWGTFWKEAFLINPNGVPNSSLERFPPVFTGCCCVLQYHCTCQIAFFQAENELICDQQSVPSPLYARSGVYTVERQTIWGVQRSIN